jgi:hypothetical protein
VKKPHYTKLLKDFVNGSASGLARLELYRLDLVKTIVIHQGWSYECQYVLTDRGRARAERLGYMKKAEETP